ncbi:MAG: hypothetical protein U1E73_12440 [Planctomycetota bacterium]
MAIASAEFFAVKGSARTTDIAAWYDLVALPNGGHRLSPTPKDAPADATATGAALFARFFAGQDPKRNEIMNLAANQLLAIADPDDPWCCYWATYALFQVGGEPWAKWNKKLDGAVTKTQATDGDDAGSWPPVAGITRAQATALRVLTLEAYYRYTRIVR